MPSEPEVAYEFGDVILVRFPFTNQTAAKQRPAVIVSSRSYNVARPDVVMMAITSQLSAAMSVGELRIADWQKANLLKPSAIKPVFATIEQSLIVRRLGQLQPSDRDALRVAIRTVLG
jgi:mRNA interferase MazF